MRQTHGGVDGPAPTPWRWRGDDGVECAPSLFYRRDAYVPTGSLCWNAPRHYGGWCDYDRRWSANGRRGGWISPGVFWTWRLCATCGAAATQLPGQQQEPWRRQQNQAGRRKPTKHAEALEKSKNHRAAVGLGGMAQPVLKTAYIYMNLAGYTPKSKWPDKYLRAPRDLSATAGPVYHLISCRGIVIRSGGPGAMASSKIERAALERCQPC